MSNIIEKAGDYVTSAKISRDVLRDKLSEFLMVEKGGLQLYDQALRIVTDAEISQKLRHFREQTARHEQVLLRVIRDLGMDAGYVSPSARVAEQKAMSLLHTMTNPDGLSSAAAEANAIENIVLAETKDHADWELLGKIARQAEDENIRDVLKPAVSEVEPEEDDHLTWAKEQMAAMEFQGVARK